MIFVTVGTSSPPFTRLLRAIAVIEPHVDHTFIVQRGKTPFKSDRMEVFDFIAEDRFCALIDNADIVVTHGGFGILATLINMGKKIVAVPREDQYGEATNPQKELVMYLQTQGALIGVYNIADLYAALCTAETFDPQYQFEKQRIPMTVKCLIDRYRKLRQRRKDSR